jgi:hypothetical protein
MVGIGHGRRSAVLERHNIQGIASRTALSLVPSIAPRRTIHGAACIIVFIQHRSTSARAISVLCCVEHFYYASDVEESLLSTFVATD